MKKLFTTLGIAVCGLTIAAVCLAQKDVPAATTNAKAVPTPKAKAADAAIDTSDDEKSIHQLIDEVEKAYNAADAKGVANLFTEDAELVDENGNVTHGRAAIEALFVAAFEAKPGATMSIEVNSIRSIGSGLLVEDGTTTVTTAPGEFPERTRYTVVHIKQDGKWRMASARDISSIAPSNVERLQQLEWLIGEWDESPDAVVTSTYRWSEDGNFIINEFSAKFAGRSVMAGTQRFGWDPLSNQIRSWMFDSTGGYGEGLWTRDGDRWVIKSRNVTNAGQVGTATNVLTRIDKDRWGWQSYDRMVGGTLTDEIEQVVVVRRPPQPDAASPQ
jgi:uncharacterized protein (TIGR02246 family)